MAKITMKIDTEQAVDIINGCAALICATGSANAAHQYNGYAFLAIENLLLMAAKAIDAEHFNGSKTSEVTWIESSVE